MPTLPRKENAMPNMRLLQTRATIALLAVAMLGAAVSASAEDKALPRTFQDTFTEIVLTLTDLALERQYQQALQERHRHQEREIQIPLPDSIWTGPPALP